MGIDQVDISQLAGIFTTEGLVALDNEGRVRPWLAKAFDVSEDGLSIIVTLRKGVRFHGGTPVDARLAADILRTTLPKFAGLAFDDVEGIEALDDARVEVRLKHPSQFVLESLEAPISESGTGAGTGPFVLASKTQLRENPDYYLGKPAIAQIDIKPYPTGRAAWADLLRGNLDMVYEVGLDELDSLQTSKTINVYSVVRHYQFVVILNSKNKALAAPSIRRALNAAIDRDALIRDGMAGHGVPSAGPVWPTNWALHDDVAKLTYDARAAAAVLSPAKLSFTCLVASDAERVALALKRQLAAVGVEVTLEDVNRTQLNDRASTGRFDAIVTSIISGPSLFRPYLWWYSKGPLNRSSYADKAVDAALDEVRHAPNDDTYHEGATAFQQAILNNPPAIFLAWTEGARAVSTAFDVSPQPGTDIIRMPQRWRPVGSAGNADKN